ncbi:DNA-directed RNA polymerase subunit beta [Candidatus Nardonella dryophthoridicola]|uniref:DNA-directed RNA polymerase subunit beta n=1 Tax=Candidatus Nardonella dryophthoridicola TaxID=1971485 RepID=UPI001AD854A6|nr:DNA-directed RNA polymerase subunit beta [Candidatus Nardonella dryophthoridicola]QTJ62841.1 DNA-directed RNA polymerase subunit beta [Candidatus Nardonella dryophthoridicola]
MNYLYFNKKRIRKNFSKVVNKLEVPNLLSIQIESFKNFINKNNNFYSIDNVLNNFFPIFDNNKNIEVRYIDYILDKSLFNTKECRIKGLTYSYSLKINLLLLQKNISTNKIIEIPFNNLYVCEIPYMTVNGTFIINGTERVVVPQLSKSPGVFFNYIKEKSSYKKKIYNAKIIPYRGSWIDIEFDNKNILFIKIDKKKKILLTVFLRAMGIKRYDILNFFFKTINVFFCDNYNIILEFILDNFNNEDLNVIDNIKNNFKIIEDYIDKNIRKIKISNKYLINKIIHSYNEKKYFDIKDSLITDKKLEFLLKNKIKNIKILFIEKYNYLPIYNTLFVDNINSQNESLIEIYKIIKQGDVPDIKIVKNLFNNLFFCGNKYNLSFIGRMKINNSLYKNNLYKNKDVKNNEDKYINKYDILFTIRKLIDIKNKKYNIDNLDDLSNKRIKLIGEMIENQFRIGISRLEKSIKEKISYISNIENLNKNDLVNSKLISSIIKEFFTSSQLSQFMDQNNSLSEITHKRRISSLGPGGLTRDRAGFEARDVHYSHYGKLCPIETPEGPNIGLINSLSLYCRVNKYGFLETPYFKVINRMITNDIVYLSSLEDYNLFITQSDIKINNNYIEDEYVMCRFKGNFLLVNSCKVNYIDISPQQIISAGVSLIPFLEHNDANRALMGTNMQRQAVPIMGCEYPLVGTGYEKIIADNSSNIIFSKRGGKVIYIDSKYIVVKVNLSEIDYNSDFDLGLDIYELNKFDRSNQNTLINNKICVELFENVNKKSILADNQCTDIGELCLGRNLKVAFMSWNGYNFEDSIIISEDLVKKDLFTSIHIQEFSCIQRETKLGPEEITCSIPNINNHNISMLDKSGIVCIGSYVNEGDILVGKLTPKEEVQLTPEEKLLRAIFGDKKLNVEDSSLRVPNGVSGTVIDIQIFYSNKFKNKDFNENSNIFIKYNIIKKNLLFIINELNNIYNIDKDLILEFIKCSDNNLYEKLLIEINKNIKNNDLFLFYKKILYKYININNLLNKDIELENIKNINISELSPGIIKIVKIYISTKRKIKEGDKISGRYGNKGVISKICPIEDMPYDEDGNIIDIILNPLGVPSRMNIGQILETNLSMGLKKIGENVEKILKDNNIIELRNYMNKIYNLFNKNCEIDFNKLKESELLMLSNNIKNGLPVSVPPFEGINEYEIKSIFEFVNFPNDGKITLYDGITGEKFDRKITVGYMYMMKLNHLVDDKIHARSTGSYSLITQQPLGGKSQFGGQRFGEMEVWALEAYGAAYTLQEMLTVKSDDIYGRIKMYKNIIKNNLTIDPSIPESFNVLLKELKSLCLNIDLKKK